MNINNVFICDVYEFVDHCLADCYSDEKFNILINNIKDENGLSKLEKKVLFIKKALVYYSKIHNRYVDLETGKIYKLGASVSSIGDLFVDINTDVLAMSDLVNSNKKNMSKRRIL